ncbi:hypothetical protein BHE74_00019027 [Ensete ventricosum]|nr:hypothetical protein BHE74_00019027 [Ensete ventricosum]
MHIRDPRKLQMLREKQIMGRSEMEERCRRHPEHRQSKGVCPFCLRDRLSQLAASSSASTTLASSANSSPPDPNSAVSSPPNQFPTARLLKHRPLKKSRSLAFMIGRPGDENNGKKREVGKEKENKRRKEGRFWSKLLIGSDRRKEVDDKTRTMKDNTTTKWTRF